VSHRPKIRRRRDAGIQEGMGATLAIIDMARALAAAFSPPTGMTVQEALFSYAEAAEKAAAEIFGESWGSFKSEVRRRAGRREEEVEN
jgi:phage I-like protein